MSKTAKTLILLTSISLVLVVYLIISSKLIVIEKEDENPAVVKKQEQVLKETVDLEALSRNYEVEIKKILDDLDTMVSYYTATSTAMNESNGTSSNQLKPENDIKATMIKTRLMSLTVPEARKDYHIQLVLAVSKFIDYSETGDMDALEEGVRILDTVKKVGAMEAESIN